MGCRLAAAVRAARPEWRILGWAGDAERSTVALADRALDGRTADPVAAAQDAEVVFITQPLRPLLATLERIAAHLRPGALVTDTALLKLPVLAQAADHLPSSVAFVGGHPVLRRGAAMGAEALRGATYCLVPAAGSGNAAVGMLAELVRAFDAEPYFIEAAEHDALVVGSTLLPDLIRSVQFALLAQSPSARDLERLCEPQRDEELQELLAWLAEAGTELAAARETTLHWLDRLLSELDTWHQVLAQADAGAIERQAAAAHQVLSTWPPSAHERPLTTDGLDEPHLLRQTLFGRLGTPRRRPPER